MAYELPPLPYPKNALEPHIDGQTMEIHHDKHHGAYVTNVNKAIAGKADLEHKSVEDLIRNLEAVRQTFATWCAITAAATPITRCSGKPSGPKREERLPASWQTISKQLSEASTL